MLYDTLENLGFYRGLAANLDTVIDFLQKNPPRQLAQGRHEIDEEKAYCTRLKCDLQPTNLWEAHRRHIDLHVALDDGETIACCNEAMIHTWSEPDAAVDARHADEPLMGARLEMKAGTFAVFFPWDAHCPQLGTGRSEKIIGKILL